MSDKASVRHIGRTHLVLGLVMLDACGPDAAPRLEDVPELWARAFCRASYACECAWRVYADEDECRDKVRAQAEDLIQLEHITYRGDCFKRMLDRMETYGCGYDAPSLPLDCVVLEGTAAPGDPCHSTPLLLTASECRPGLRCNGRGTCYDPEAPSPHGDLRTGLGEPCDWDERFPPCEPDLYCNAGDAPGSVGSCEAKAAVGEPCASRFGCQSEPASNEWPGSMAYCHASGVCVERDLVADEAGQPCDPLSSAAESWSTRADACPMVRSEEGAFRRAVCAHDSTCRGPEPYICTFARREVQ